MTTPSTSDVVSPTRLYLGNLPTAATKENVKDFFEEDGIGEIKEIKIMNGFGFIEYGDEADARDIVPAYHGKDFMGKRLTVQYARGNRPKDSHGERPNAPRPRRTQFRMNILGLPSDTSWQDLKDFARKSGCDVVYSETSRGGGAFVEFESATDLDTACKKLNNDDFKGHQVECKPDILDAIPTSHPPRNRSSSPRRFARHGYEDYRYGARESRPYYPRERTPPGYRGGGRDEYYGRPRYPYEDPYGPPRHAPRYEGYDRIPPRADPYEERFPPRPYARDAPPSHYERERADMREPYYESRPPRNW